MSFTRQIVSRASTDRLDLLIEVRLQPGSDRAAEAVAEAIELPEDARLELLADAPPGAKRAFRLIYGYAF